MAEGLLNRALREAGQNEIMVKSAGLDALVGEPPDKMAQSVMLEQGVDISSHRAQLVNRDLIYSADIILVMDEAHKHSLEAWEPSARGRIYRLGEWSRFDVPDPYRQTRDRFEVALKLINKGISDWMPILIGMDKK